MPHGVIAVVGEQGCCAQRMGSAQRWNKTFQNEFVDGDQPSHDPGSCQSQVELLESTQREGGRGKRGGGEESVSPQAAEAPIPRPPLQILATVAR